MISLRASKFIKMIIALFDHFYFYFFTHISFWMFSNIDEVICITLDRKIKTPVAIYPGLPDISLSIILFCSQRRMAQIFEEENGLLIEGASNKKRGCLVLLFKVLGMEETHLSRALRFFSGLLRAI